MNVKEKIDKLRIKRDWSLSRLAKELGISETTVYSWYNDQNYMPSRATIETACDVFRITLAEFYSEIDMDSISAKEVVLVESFRRVPNEQKDQVLQIVKSFERD